jgi:hypothetical protein
MSESSRTIQTKSIIDPKTAMSKLLREVDLAGVDDNINGATANLISDQLAIHGEFYTNRETGKSYVSLDSLAIALTSVLRTHVGSVSDGSHTFDELYDHRCLLFISLMRMVSDGLGNAYGLHDTWFSKLHDDGSSFDGYIIVGILTDKGQCTYHVKDNPYGEILRNATNVREIPKAPAWDGHNSNDVLDRLSNAFFNLKLSDMQ